MTSTTEIDEDAVQALLEKYAETRDVAVRDEIVLATLWLAQRAARRFANGTEPLDDLIQVANIGLLKAIDRFDVTRGISFGGYATPTIVGELRRYFRDHSWAVHVSRTTKDRIPGIRSAAEELTRQFGRSPTAKEIAQLLEISEDAVLESLEANGAYRAVGVESINQSGLASDEQGFNDVLNAQAVWSLLDRLPPRERHVLHLRFFVGLTQQQIAEKIGMSQVHVGRLIASSLSDLRGMIDQPI